MGQPEPNAKLCISGFKVSAAARFCQAIIRLIWSSFSPKQKVRTTGPNPAKGRLRDNLDNQFNSKCHETLGHKNTLDNEYNQGPKV